VRPHYPAECPATPDDAWAFASFGAYLAGTTVPREQRSMLDALRALRNTFAHGHYVSWASVRRLQDLEARLGDV
jgi:hypothetical protein